MALRNQPYLPLYVQDFISDEKLRECSAESVGVYIFIMCLLHKSETYGSMQLKEKYITSSFAYTFAYDFALPFASMLLKHLPFKEEVISNSLVELIKEGVLSIDTENYTLYQKRMVKDGLISIKRAEAGEKGGKVSKVSSKTEANIQANIQANTENENEYVNEDDIDIISLSHKDLKHKDKEIEILTQHEYDFKAFWEAYPKKVGKKEAQKSWSKVKVDIDVILNALEIVKNTDDWKKQNGKFIPYPATWLNGARWEDEIQPTKASTNERLKEWIKECEDEQTGNRQITCSH